MQNIESKMYALRNSKDVAIDRPDSKGKKDLKRIPTKIENPKMFGECFYSPLFPMSRMSQMNHTESFAKVACGNVIGHLRMNLQEKDDQQECRITVTHAIARDASYPSVSREANSKRRLIKRLIFTSTVKKRSTKYRQLINQL